MSEGLQIKDMPSSIDAISRGGDNFGVKLVKPSVLSSLKCVPVLQAFPGDPGMWDYRAV